MADDDPFTTPDGNWIKLSFENNEFKEKMSVSHSILYQVFAYKFSFLEALTDYTPNANHNQILDTIPLKVIRNYSY